MRVPVATYRVQLHDDFTLIHARSIVAYLARLGVSDLYLSPVFDARRGSRHGYDVTDPTRVRASLGGETALRELAHAAQRHGMALLLDIVPNHMAASHENPWWRDLLRHGRGSAYAHYFDIDWSRGERLILPILGDELDTLVHRGELILDHTTRELVYYEHRLPLSDATTLPTERTPESVRAVLARQHYELVHWRAADRINYRRFFDILDLVGLRVEADDVFDATHALVRRLAAEGVIAGVRIDHIDGLRDPTAYLARLREQVRGPTGEPTFTVVEKILQRGERLPDDWQCDGTTGYEFLNLVTGVLIDPDGFDRIEAFYRRVTGDEREFGGLAHEKKLLVIDRLFGGELRALAERLSGLVDRSVADCAAAVRAVSASLDVYRTYIRSLELGREDRRRIEAAVADALRRAPELEATIDAVRRVLTLQHEDPTAALEWVLRWQQFTGPVTAKGFEDTALYCHNALLAVNDVGSDPARPCVTPDQLLAALRERGARQPRSLSATATHDTKRGEDTRARIAVLSEIPDEWRARLRRWMRAGDEWKADVADEEDRIVADADVDNLLYQTLLGAWPVDGATPAFAERVQQYMMKAVREAKEHTSWRRPDEDYEQALAAFVSRLMGQAGRAGLPEEIAGFAQRIAPHGALNSLAQLLLKVTAPGIPDIYQGTELWSFTLVDPDNRGPVDYSQRCRLLDELEPLIDRPEPERVRRLLDDWYDGRLKLFVTAAALRWRRRHAAAFAHGAIVPLAVTGTLAERVITYGRRHTSTLLVTAVTRWSTRSQAEWAAESALQLPGPRAWRNVLTGETLPAGGVPLDALFHTLPCALLEPEPEPPARPDQERLPT